MADDLRRELLGLRVELAITQTILARVTMQTGLGDLSVDEYFDVLEKDFSDDYLESLSGGGDTPGMPPGAHDFALESLGRLRVLFSASFNR